jgi:hypothetical protein
MKIKSQLKNTLASALMVSTLLVATPGRSDTMGGAMQIVGSTVGMLMSLFLTPNLIQQAGVNVDAAQAAAELAVWAAMKDVTYKWPPMEEEYVKAGKSNEDNKKIESPTSKKTALPFEVQTLNAVGLEALGIQGLNALLNARGVVITDLSKMQLTANSVELKSSETTDRVLEKIAQTQNDNYRYLSTAGIARAELGLKTTYNAAANAQGAGTPDITETSPDANDVQSVAEQVQTKEYTEQQKRLIDLPASVTSIGYAMRVQTLMNLELAQRINLSNALQSSILSIEAARELKNAGTRRNN